MRTSESVARHARVRRLFEALSEKSEEERTEILDEACRQDASLRPEINLLLQNSAAADERFHRLESEVLVPALNSLHGDPLLMNIWLDFQNDDNTGVPDPLAGKTVSHFEIIERIGRGGMGVVYKARDLNLDRTVALKFLPPALSADEAAKDRFIQEARTASALEHPNIATIHEIDETGDHQWFIAMRYFPGETLKEKIEKGPIPPAEVLDTAVQLAGALAQAHQKGIVHRDIKPGNIIADEDDRLSLLDFGLAELIQTTGQRLGGQLLGTVAYMSPEQTQRKAVDGRSDLWSLGVVLFEMLTGERPFQGEDQPSVVRGILEQDPLADAPFSNLSERCPDELTKIIGTCLAKDPADRYQSAEDLLVDLEHIREGTARKAFYLGLARTLAFAAIVVVSLILGYRSFFAPPVVPLAMDSLAVLPFENLSGDPEQLFFVDGFQEGIRLDLARFEALAVINPSSALRFRETNRTPREIATELGVKAVLTGSVERRDGRIRVAARLTDASEGKDMWSKTYERTYEPTEVFELQGAIVSDVAKALETEVPEAFAPELTEPATAVLPALEAFYQARAARLAGTAEGRRAAIEHYQRAIELDVDFAEAMAGLAATYVEQIWQDGLTVTPQAALAAPLIERALSLDDRLAEAHLARGGLQWLLGDDAEVARASYARVLELNPSHARAHCLLGDLLMDRFGAPSEVLPLYERGIQLDPLYLGDRLILADALRRMRRYDEARGIFQAALDRNPENLGACLGLGLLLHYGTNQCHEALVCYRKAHALAPADPYIPFLIRQIYARLGEPEGADVWAKPTAALAPDSWMAHPEIVAHHLREGEEAPALAYLRATPYEDSRYGFRTAGFKVLRDACLGTGNSDQVLKLFEREFPDFIDPRDLVLPTGSVTIVDDPFPSGQGKVLKVFPGTPGQLFYRVKANRPLPTEARVVDRGQKGELSTFYFKVGRLSVNGRPGRVDVASGLAASTTRLQDNAFGYGDFSVEVAYQPDGSTKIWDGENYMVDLHPSPLDTDVYYELWFVIDHSGNTYDLYIRGGRQFPQQTLVFEDAPYRVSTRDALDRFLLITTTGRGTFNPKGEDSAYFDNILMDPNTANLGTPDAGWTLVDDFEDGDASDWNVYNAVGAAVGLTGRFGRVASLLLWSEDEASQADLMMEAIASTGSPPKFRQFSHLITQMRALRGERNRVLEEMREQLEAGWGWKGKYDGEEFDWLRKDPDFQAIVAEMEDVLAAQLDRIRELVDH